MSDIHHDIGFKKQPHSAGHWLPKPVAWLPDEQGQTRRHFLWLMVGLGATSLAIILTGFYMVRSPVPAYALWGLQIFFLLLLGGLLLSAIACVQRCLLHPLGHVSRWAAELRQGNLAARVPEAHSEAFAELARDINLLGDQLQTLSRDMENQVQQHTERLAQKTRSLELLYDVAASINMSSDVHDLLSRFLFTLKDLLNARAACARLLNKEGRMQLVASVGLDAAVINREAEMATDCCLCGQALSQGRLQQQDSMRRCEAKIGLRFFQDQNVHMLAVPLQYRDRTLGVYNLFIDEQCDYSGAELNDLLTSVGRHLGVAIEKAHLDIKKSRLSRMEERARLANELHDSLAQTLASLRFQVRVLDETLHQGDECATWEEMEKVEDSLDRAYTELRELIAHFRAPIDKRGLIPAIETLVSRFRQETGSGIFFQNRWQDVELAPETELQVQRIIQEALTNIKKYAKANTVRILLRKDNNGHLLVLIEDDGIGFSTTPASTHPGNHIGLSIMQERAQSIGAELAVDSEPGEGTRILLELDPSLTRSAAV